MYKIILYACLGIGTGLLGLGIYLWEESYTISSSITDIVQRRLDYYCFFLGSHLLIKTIFLQYTNKSFSKLIVGISLAFDLVILVSCLILGLEISNAVGQIVPSTYNRSIDLGKGFLMVLFGINLFSFIWYLIAAQPETKIHLEWQEEILDVEE